MADTIDTQLAELARRRADRLDLLVRCMIDIATIDSRADHPDYDLHIKHIAPNQVTAIVWLMGRRYEGTLTCRLGR